MKSHLHRLYHFYFLSSRKDTRIEMLIKWSLKSITAGWYRTDFESIKLLDKTSGPVLLTKLEFTGKK